MVLALFSSKADV